MKVLMLLGLPLVAVLALVFGVVVILSPAGSGLGGTAGSVLAGGVGCLAQPPAAVADVHLDGQQRRVARTVVAIGRGLGVPSRGWVVALAAGMQESGLRPLDYGDRDSLGVFQQRTAWAPAAVRMDPAAAARMFFTGGRTGQRGLLDIPGWQQMGISQAAQAVQVSAYPDAYTKWQPLAVRLVHALAPALSQGGMDCQNTAGSAGSRGSVGAGRWVFPLGTAPRVLTAGFGRCGSLWSACHTGQDFAAPVGTPVAAAGVGVVVFAGRAGAYGNLVKILHPGGTATWYAHLSRGETHTGARVGAGQLIGLVGQTGNTTGPHLHFEVRHHATPTSSGTPVDPLPWLHAHHLRTTR